MVQKLRLQSGQCGCWQVRHAQVLLKRIRQVGVGVAGDIVEVEIDGEIERWRWMEGGQLPEYMSTEHTCRQDSILGLIHKTPLWARGD